VALYFKPANEILLLPMLHGRLPLWRIIQRSFRELVKKDPLRLAGATAFFTTFALPAVLFIILQLSRVVLTRRQGGEELLTKLTNYVGRQSATHLINVLNGFEKIAEEPLAIAAGFLLLVFVATTLFKVIKNSLNEIWDIKVVRKISAGLTLQMRFRELVIILTAGVLFMLTLFIEGLQSMASKEWMESSAFVRLLVNTAVSFIVSVVIVTIWFGIIFYFLPDGRYPLKNALAGAFVTAILFNLGKLLLRKLLLSGNLHMIFGQAAAVVLLLLFVFYAALIFYFGAAYTKIMANSKNIRINPLPHAALYEVKPKGNVTSSNTPEL
jgi:membrane protein